MRNKASEKTPNELRLEEMVTDYFRRKEFNYRVRALVKEELDRQRPGRDFIVDSEGEHCELIKQAEKIIMDIESGKK